MDLSWISIESNEKKNYFSDIFPLWKKKGKIWEQKLKYTSSNSYFPSDWWPHGKSWPLGHHCSDGSHCNTENLQIHGVLACSILILGWLKYQTNGSLK